MQIAPFYDHERKNVYDWGPFDYLHWLRNIQDMFEDSDEAYHDVKEKVVKMVADGLFERIRLDTEKKRTS